MESDKNKKPENIFDDPQAIFKTLKPEYKRSKEEVWNTLSEEIKSLEVKDTSKKARKHRVSLSIAASLLLFFSALAGLRFITLTISCPKGEKVSVTLPHGSTLILNADSELKYYRYWWFISRNMELQGEGYFEVSSGKPFTVSSINGSTKVFGTSFNIYSRKDSYRVRCVEGKVGVTIDKQDIFLTKGKGVDKYRGRKLQTYDSLSVSPVAEWRENRIVFTSTPLRLVFEELERQYNVELKYQKDLDYFYTGSFSSTIGIENALSIVCKPFILNFEPIKDSIYRISKID